MTPKRIIVFIVLMVGSPFWLVLRSHYGERFTVLLLTAWGSGFGIVWLVAQGYVPDVPRDVIWTARLVQHCFEVSAWMWAGQLAMMAMYWSALVLRECERRHHWYVGSFWLSTSAGAVMTLLGLIASLLWFSVITTELPRAAHATAYWAFAIMAGSFVALLYVSGISDGLLPFKPPLSRLGRRKLPVRYIARPGSPARRSREGLAHIFSRREAALRAMIDGRP